jgi:prepilin-type processing-associated H-X9-DG protein
MTFSGRDALVPHGLNIPSPPRPELGLWRAQGFLNYDGGNSENTNTALFLDPHYAKLAPYSQNAALYKCPSDKSMVKLSKSKFAPRVRSISLNSWAGGLFECGVLPSPLEYGPQRLSAILNPASLLTFIDEHPDSLDFVSFWVPVRRSTPLISGTFTSWPSSLHGGTASIAFADGHVELHKWVDPRTKMAPTYTQRIPLDLPIANNRDVAWLQERAFESAP